MDLQTILADITSVKLLFNHLPSSESATIQLISNVCYRFVVDLILAIQRNYPPECFGVIDSIKNVFSKFCSQKSTLRAFVQNVHDFILFVFSIIDMLPSKVVSDKTVKCHLVECMIDNALLFTLPAIFGISAVITNEYKDLGILVSELENTDEVTAGQIQMILHTILFNMQHEKGQLKIAEKCLCEQHIYNLMKYMFKNILPAGDASNEFMYVFADAQKIVAGIQSIVKSYPKKFEAPKRCDTISIQIPQYLPDMGDIPEPKSSRTSLASNSSTQPCMETVPPYYKCRKDICPYHSR